MHHGQVQADRRLGEARHLHTQQSAALGTASRLRARSLVDLGPVPPLRQPKGRVLRRVPVRHPPSDTAALDSGGAAPALTPFPATAVHHDLDPWGLPKASPKHLGDLRPVDACDDHPSRPLRTHTAGFHVSAVPLCYTADATPRPYRAPAPGARREGIASAIVIHS